MDIVGKRFASSEIYVPEMLVSATTMKRGLGIIKPLLKSGEAENRGTVVMGTVKGDLHDIGKNLVTMMMEGAGFKIIDLGVDVKIEDLIEIVKKEKADILGLSALLTTTMPQMKLVIESLEEAGIRNQLKVIVGGAPIDQGFADKIGADGFGADAVEAVQLARKLVAEN
jgi:methylmalonyl-CoA mutase cobalamin-binding domain/chain